MPIAVTGATGQLGRIVIQELIRRVAGNDEVNGGTKAGDAALTNFIAHHYHTPLDNFNPQWDFAGDVEDANAPYEVGRQLAGSSEWPTWYKDSPFRAKRVEMMHQ